MWLTSFLLRLFLTFGSGSGCGCGCDGGGGVGNGTFPSYRSPISSKHLKHRSRSSCTSGTCKYTLQLHESKPQCTVLFSKSLCTWHTNCCGVNVPLQSTHSTQRESRDTYKSGVHRPRHLPKQRCNTENVKVPLRGRNCCGGDWGCKRALHRRSASVFVIKPQLGALHGRILWLFSTFNCSGVHLGRKEMTIVWQMKNVKQQRQKKYS